ncbi:hypothetical protein BGW38_006774 [Lunasporangiospora selenospora]|uniref:Uncharacterized protein n=1 Tax=Lunasporangiospora selenospora TaxID=979761 RepID=A0A9P6FMI0_9FUNG|nr:hypothetical protein BGW38_006774 [Lunasporangiospora selenospora]
MQKSIKNALSTITKGLSNPQYFEDTLPINYDISTYCTSCGKEPLDKELEREWVSTLVPRLRASDIKVFQETATRLEKTWKVQKRARLAERSEEDMDNKMRKLLDRAKLEHRATTLEHSSRTLARDFQAFDPSPVIQHKASSAIDAIQSPTSPISPSTSAGATPSTASLTSSSSSPHVIVPANATPVADNPLFDPSTAETILLTIAGVEIGKGFKQLQHEAAPVVNDMTKKLTLERLPLFMACNYILHLDSELAAIDENDMEKIRMTLQACLMSLPKGTVLLCNALDDELLASGWVRSKESAGEAESLRSLYQQLDRRGDPNKPDATVIKDTFEVGFVEIKPPREERHEKAFLEDQWALAIFAKDAIDYHLRHDRPFKTIPCLQVFGFQLVLYKLEFMSGLYVWQHVGVAYLPRDRNDRGTVAGSMALLRTFKRFIQDIETRHYIHTPPKKIHDDDLPDDLRPRPSNLSPKSRSFYPSVHASLISN